MFSGIVEACGRVSARSGTRISIEAPQVLSGAALGDSIAVNGCCLTIAELDVEWFSADLLPETLRRTNLGGLHEGDPVNLEAALRFGERVGGHLVSGHVDATGTVTAVVEDATSRRVTIGTTRELMPLISAQGCIAVDGVSLTVTDVSDAAFAVSLIPHTLAVTTAGRWTAGSRVNLEVDMAARSLQRLLQSSHQAAGAAPGPR